MELINIFFALLFPTLAAALPPVKHVSSSASTSSNPKLQARQLLQDGAVTYCCDNCQVRYDYDTYWFMFDDLCTWLGGAQSLWTTQAYYTGDYYCRPYWDPNVCVRLQVQYWCGGSVEAPVSDANPAGAMRVDYAGCMGYFQDAIEPADICAGPPYPGAKTVTADKCWEFSVIAEDSPYTMSAMSAIAVPVDDHHAAGADCEPGVRLCPIPTSPNGTVLEGAVAKAKFGPAVEKKVM